MAIVLVQTKSGNAGAYSNTNVQTLTSSVTAGSLLVMGITTGAADTISTIADTQLNTWTFIDSTVATDRKTFLYYAKNVAAGSTTVTVTYAAATFPDSILQIREYSGCDTSAPFDVSAKGDDGAGFVQTHSTATSSATSVADEVIVVMGGSSGSSDPVFAAGSGYGHLAAQSGFDAFTYAASEDKIVSATGTQSATLTTTGFVNGQIILGTFKQASAGAVVTKKLGLLGVG